MARNKPLERRLRQARALYDAEVNAAHDRYRLRIGNALAHYLYGATREEYARGPKGPRKESQAAANAAGE